MVRKLALAVALALGGATMTAQGLGLGDIKARSVLNQNFDADIALLSVPTEELDTVRVQLAPEEAFERAGVDRAFLLTRLNFVPDLAADGRPIIRVTSDVPIREPFLNFLVEVNWPRGRLVREYTVLLDPPLTTDRRPTAVAAPVTAPRPAAVAQRPAPAPAFTGSQYGPVQANETLWTIAEQVRPDAGVSMAQTMMALLQANPQAFIDNNINNLKRGQILRVPSRDEMLGISRAEAQAMYRQQQEAWQAARSRPAGVPVETAVVAEGPDGAAPGDGVDAAGAGTEPAPEDQLRIASARPGDEDIAAGASEGIASEDPALADLNNQVMLAREEAESSRQEAELLRTRIDALRQQLEDMQRLLTLKDDQLAQLQATVGQEPPGDVPAESATDSESAAPTPMDEAPAPAAEALAEAEAPAPLTADATAVADETVVSPEAEAPVDVAPLGEETVAPVLTDAGEPEVAEEGVPGVEGEPTEIVIDTGEATEGVPPAPVLEPLPEAPVAEALPADEPPAAAETPEPAAPVEPQVSADAPAQPTPADKPLLPFLQHVNLPIVAGAVGVVALLGALFGLLVARRGRRQGNETVAATAPAAAAGGAALGESSLLNDLTSADLDAIGDDLDEVDPVSEADVYIAYGRYQQAEKLLREALQSQPDRLALEHKLLEVYYATRDSGAFVRLAGEMMADGKDQADPRSWERVKEMGRELDPENAMFSAVVEEEAPAPVAQEEPEGDDLGLDDLELSELARDLEDEGDELGRGAIPPPADDVLGGGLNEALDDLGDRISATTDSISEDDLSSLEVDLPPTEATRGSDREQEMISLDELEFGDSVSAEAQDLLKGLEAGDDEDLGADSVMKVDTDLEPSELEAELEKLTELSTLADEGADATAMPPAADESGFDLESVFERDDEQDDLSALDFYDGEAEAEVGEDEVQTKLDLAKAYVEMGDMDGARSILEEVQEEGSANQKDEAGRLLAQLAS